MRLIVKFTGYSARTSTTRIRTVFSEEISDTNGDAYWMAIRWAIDRWCQDNTGEQRGAFLAVEELDT